MPQSANKHTANDKLEELIALGLDMGVERDRMALLRKIVFSGQSVANCQAGTMFLKTEDDRGLRFALRTNDDPLPTMVLPLYDPQTGEPVHRFVATHVALSGEAVVIDDVYTETRFDLSGTKRFSEESGIRTISMLTVPMMPREGEVIGVLQFINALDRQTGAITVFKPQLVRLVQAMAAQAAVALDNLQLVESQKNLLDAMIRIMAGAIDAKSPYTGGHCERVPELAFMLAEKAETEQQGPLADFRFKNEDEWREFRIGAWLHDCGKVTSPEYVVDKATKLEANYNRIHEVRTRFEVLWRDAEIDALKAVAAGTPPDEALAQMNARRQQLQDDFAFVAESNVGGEFMAAERVQRLERIATQTWERHFDDRLGLSHEELRRYTHPERPFPVVENLLSDKPEHVVPRTEAQKLDPQYGFKVRVPENLFNFGEVYNLRIGRGTLTEEERFKINEHIIQTIIMLEQLPLPRNLRRVPEYAGTHHETLIGTGYPRRLTAADLSVPSRIMAIADIFEALTASDRPYKKAKTLSESIRILYHFKKDKHIDADLFDLFLTSGVYLAYAQRFLHPDQIDEVDIQSYLGPV
jgi:HD-GYP domain-containing protein (c-di-GMP phosphodiesterase class II)